MIKVYNFTVCTVTATCFTTWNVQKFRNQYQSEFLLFQNNADGNLDPVRIQYSVLMISGKSSLKHPFLYGHLSSIICAYFIETFYF